MAGTDPRLGKFENLLKKVVRYEEVAKQGANAANLGDALLVMHQMKPDTAALDGSIDRWIDATDSMTKARQLTSKAGAAVDGGWEGAARNAFMSHVQENKRHAAETNRQIGGDADSVTKLVIKIRKEAQKDYDAAVKDTIGAGTQLLKDGWDSIVDTVFLQENARSAADVIQDCVGKITERHNKQSNRAGEYTADLQNMRRSLANVELPNEAPVELRGKVGTGKKDGWRLQPDSVGADKGAKWQLDRIEQASTRVRDASVEWSKAGDFAWWAGEIPGNAFGSAFEDVAKQYKERICRGDAKSFNGRLRAGGEELGREAGTLRVIGKGYEWNAEQNKKAVDQIETEAISARKKGLRDAGVHGNDIRGW